MLSLVTCRRREIMDVKKILQCSLLILLMVMAGVLTSEAKFSNPDIYTYDSKSGNWQYKRSGEFYISTLNESGGISVIGRSEQIQLRSSTKFDMIKIYEVYNLDKIDLNSAKYTSELSSPTYGPYNINIEFNAASSQFDPYRIYAVLTYNSQQLVGLSFFTGEGISPFAIRINGRNVSNDEYDFTCIYNTDSRTASIVGTTYFGKIEIPEMVAVLQRFIDGSPSGPGYTVNSIIADWQVPRNLCYSIYIPSTVKEIGYNAFSGMSMLEEVFIDNGNDDLKIWPIFDYATSSYRPAFADCQLEKVYMGRPFEYAVSTDSKNQNLTHFCQQVKLKEIEFGSAVQFLPVGCLEGCVNLSNVTLSSKLHTIYENAFAGCRSLQRLSLPQSLKRIGAYAFSSCYLLNYLILPSEIQEIGIWSSNATSNPNGVFGPLSEIICLYDKTIGCPIVSKNVKVLVPDASTYGWGENIIDIDDGATKWEYTGMQHAMETRPNYSENFKELYDIQCTYNSECDSINVGDYDTTIPTSLTWSSGKYDYDINLRIQITPAPLYIKAPNLTRQYGKENPEITLEYEGFRNNETAAALLKLPQIHIDADQNSPIGEYPISVTDAEARNYSISYEPGVLTITKADQTIEWIQNLSGVKVGDEVDLTAIASSGLAVEYTSSNPDVAEIDGSHVKFHGVGSVKITAIQCGDTNHNAASSIEKKIKVSPIYVETISLNAIDKCLEVGETLQLEAVITPVNATVKELRWESSHPEVASISENGLVSTLDCGTTTITAYATDGSKVSTSCVITVSLPTGISSINKDGLKFTIERNRIIRQDSDCNMKIAIFNMSGKLIYQGTDRIISLPAGIYIMSISDKYYKIIL